MNITMTEKEAKKAACCPGRFTMCKPSPMEVALDFEGVSAPISVPASKAALATRGTPEPLVANFLESALQRVP